MRGGLAIAAVLCGAVSVGASLARVIATGAPAQAHQLAPADGSITAALAARRFATELGVRPTGVPIALARQAIGQDPTVVPAFVTLGLAAQLRGDLPKARALFGYAQTLSRRNLQTQLWQIEDAVQRGDVRGAVGHYDIALRTSQTAPDLLFPVLAAAIADPAVRTVVVPTLAAKPGWADAFISFVARGSGDPRVTASLFAGLRRAGAPVFEDARVAATSALIARGTVDDAWAYYVSDHPGADRRRSRDPEFTADWKTPSPFDWVATDDGGISSSFQRAGSGGTFHYATATGAGGVLLRQLQVLPPGAYVLSGRASAIDPVDAARPYWTLTCGDGHEAGRVAIPASASSAARFAGRIVIPGGCPVQTLALIGQPSDAVAGLMGQIDRAALAPAS